MLLPPQLLQVDEKEKQVRNYKNRLGII